jgi:hypothetical protein
LAQSANQPQGQDYSATQMAPSKDQTIVRLTQLLEQQAQQAAQQMEAMREQQAMMAQLLANQQCAQPQMQQFVNQSAQHANVASSLDNRIGRFNYDPDGGCTFNAWY